MSKSGMPDCWRATPAPPLCAIDSTANAAKIVIRARCGGERFVLADQGFRRGEGGR